MSWHHAKPSSKRRHAPPVATAAVAAILLLALGACSSTPSAGTAGNPAPTLATATAIPAGRTGALTGPGPHSTRRSSPPPSPGTSSSTRA